MIHCRRPRQPGCADRCALGQVECSRNFVSLFATFLTITSSTSRSSRERELSPLGGVDEHLCSEALGIGVRVCPRGAPPSERIRTARSGGLRPRTRDLPRNGTLLCPRDAA